MSSVMIGVLKARIEAEAAQMKQEVQAVKKGIADLGEEGKKTSRSFTDLNATMAKVAANTDHLKAIEQQLKKIDPAKMEQGLAAVVAELQKMGAERKQVETLEQALTEMAQAAKTSDIRVEELVKELQKLKEQLEKTNDETDKTTVGFNTLASAIAGLGAGAAMSKLISMTQTLASEANQLGNSYRGLSVVAGKFNVDTEAAIGLADKLADRWGLNKGVLSDTVKTYLTLNLSLEETERIITATADAAAYNRQAHLSWDEAIKQVAEGIKAGNSNLTDAAGITTNLSVMQERYAKSIGTTAAKLSETQKVQAAYNGMLEEGAIFAGNADDAMTGFTGTQASFNSTLQEARTVLGEAYIPALEETLELLTPLIKDLSIWVETNKENVVGLTAAAAAVTGLIAVVSTLIAVVAGLKMAFVALNISMGPIGWAIAGISALAVGVTAYSVAADAASNSVWKFALNQEELNNKLAESPLNRSVEDVKNMQADYEKLNELLDKRTKLEGRINELREDMKRKMAKTGGGFVAAPRELAEASNELSKLNQSLEDLGVTSNNANEVLQLLKQQIEASSAALRELRMEELREIAAKQDAIAESETLSDRYHKLRESTKLTAEQNAEMTRVVQQLTQRYPELQAEMDEQGQLLITNEGLLRDLIKAEQDSVTAMLTAETAKRQSLIRTTEAAIKSAEAQVNAIKAVAEAEAPKSRSFLEGSVGNDWLVSEVHAGLPETVKKVEAATAESIRKLNAQLTEYKTELAAIENGTWRSLLEDETKKNIGNDTGTGSSLTKTKAELEREKYQEELKLIEYKKNLDKMNEQQELAALDKLLTTYKNNADIRMELEVRIHQLKKQMAADEEKRREEETKKSEQAARERFEHSSNWITQEERRMVLAGESEEAIAKMKMEAWTRVRSRYEKDSEYYKQADTQLYNLRVELIRKTERAQQEVAREQETRAKDALKRSLDAIDKAKRAELNALNERRKAIRDFYEDRTEIIEEGERLKERNDIIAEMEKYRYATSERGQAHYNELKEKLRQWDLEAEKRTLTKERDEKLAALDKQQDDIETWYAELKTMLEDYSGNSIAIYELTEDARFNAFMTTNAKIKAELQRFQAEYSAIMSSVSSGGSSAVQVSTIAQMDANAKAWHTADAATKAKLKAENERLGASIGATKDSATGKWYGADGLPLFHTGRDGVTGGTFSAGNMLMPDEITAILRDNEYVFTPGQLRSLLDGRGTNQPSVVNNYNAPLIEHSGDVLLEDKADIQTYNAERFALARRLLAKGERL